MSIASEVRIARIRPRLGLRRWRWDVVHYRPIEGRHPGVFDSRLHLIGDFGYTFTWLGAAIAAAKVVWNRPDEERPS